MKALLQAGLSGQVPAPPEKRFLISQFTRTVERSGRDGFVFFWRRSQQNRSASMIRPASALPNGGLYPILTFMPDFHMLPDMKTMFQGWFQAVSTGVYPYRQKSDFLSIPWPVEDFTEHQVPVAYGNTTTMSLAERFTLFSIWMNSDTEQKVAWGCRTTNHELNCFS